MLKKPPTAEAAVAKAEREARNNKQRELTEEKRKVEEKIQELEAKKGELEKEIERLSRDAEVTAVLSSLGDLLIPAEKAMLLHEKKREIQQWIES